jgi:outer membrane protein TolC
MPLRLWSSLACLALTSLAHAQGREQAPPAPEALLETSEGGLTADKVGERAVATSYAAKASEEALRAAAARVDAAWGGFLPRLSGLARYTRLSELTPAALGGGQGALVATAPPTCGQPSCPVNPNQLFTLPQDAFKFPVFFDNWTFQATIIVPISDYPLRIAQSYTAATLSRDAARFDLAAAKAKAYADGKIAYYQWVRARGSVAVAQRALEDQKIHKTDAENLFAVGRANKADVLRVETAVAAAELALERSKNLVELTEKQLRVAMHDEQGQPLVMGEGIDASMPPFQGSLQQLIQEALTSRMEVKSIEASAQALKKNATATRNGVYPQLSAAGNLTYQNPNQRLFPSRQEFFPTWDVSIQLTWSPNDILTYRAQGAALEAQAMQLEAQKGALRDAIQLEVTQAYQALKEAELAVSTSQRELDSAKEAYRVAHELFVSGTATSTTLTDAQTELVRARLDQLNARVDQRTARVRLEHALGRDAKLPE